MKTEVRDAPCLLPYSRKLSKEKTFANFVVLGLSAKVFSRENRWPHPLIILAPSDPRKFSLQISRFPRFMKVFSLESFPLYGIFLVCELFCITFLYLLLLLFFLHDAAGL